MSVFKNIFSGIGKSKSPLGKGPSANIFDAPATNPAERSEKAAKSLPVQVVDWKSDDVGQWLTCIQVHEVPLGTGLFTHVSKLWSLLSFLQSGSELLKLRSESDMVDAIIDLQERMLEEEEQQEEQPTSDEIRPTISISAEKLPRDVITNRHTNLIIPFGFIRTMWIYLNKMKNNENKFDSGMIANVKAKRATQYAPGDIEGAITAMSKEKTQILKKDVRTLSTDEVSLLLQECSIAPHYIRMFSLEQVTGEVLCSMKDSDCMRYFGLSRLDTSSLTLARLVALVHDITEHKFKFNAASYKKATHSLQGSAAGNHPQISLEDAMKVVIRKICQSSRLAQTLDKDELDDYALNLCDPANLKDAYLNKEFGAIKKMFSSLTDTSEKTKQKRKTFLPSSRPSHTDEPDDININMDSIEKQEIQNAFGLTAREGENVKIKLVIAEIAKSGKEKTMRKLLSPIISELNMNANFGWFHSALIVGPWYVEWNNSGLIIPRRCYSSAALIAVDLKTEITGSLPLDVVIDRMASVIVEWNVHREYHQSKANCQHFVDSLCEALGIKLDFSGSLSHYLKKLRTKGLCSISWKIPETVREIANITEKKKAFKTHKELDMYVTQLIQKYPLFREENEDDYNLLKSFDRAFWLRSFRTPTNEDYAPISKHELCQHVPEIARDVSHNIYKAGGDDPSEEVTSIGCPFGDPTTSSFTREWF